MSRRRQRLRPCFRRDQNGSYRTEERTEMAKYLLLKHYRGAPAPVNNVSMDQWTPQEITDHVQFMRDFATRLEQTGEFVAAEAVAPEGTWVQYGGEGRPP